MLFNKILPSLLIAKSVTLNQANTITTGLSSSYTFNYGDTINAGSFVVIVVTARAGSISIPGAWDSVTDSAGNLFTEATEGTQSNALTFTGIYYCELTDAVDTSTVITATSTSTAGYNTAQHGTVFVLTGVNTLDNTYSSPASTVSNVSASANTSTGEGIAIHAISTGLGTIGVINSLSSGFIEQRSTNTGTCQQFIASSIFDQSANTSVNNTFGMSASANWASVMAIFK